MLSASLVDLKRYDSRLILEVRYATAHNFTGKPLYDFRGTSPTIFVHRDLAERLHRVQNELDAQGLRLKIFDGYRPLSVQYQLWQRVQDERYVSNPTKNKGRHTRGTAVDCTLCDAAGNELLMPTLFDDFTERAHASATKGISPDARRNRDKLIAVMKKHGLIVLPTEWWHFDLDGWRDDKRYPALDCLFDDLIGQ